MLTDLARSTSRSIEIIGEDFIKNIKKVQQISGFIDELNDSKFLEFPSYP
jgi:hypothetical protein